MIYIHKKNHSRSNFFAHLKRRRTKRAPDVWDSAAFSGIFLASSFFLLPNRIHARPHAGNANRWAFTTFRVCYRKLIGFSNQNESISPKKGVKK